MSFEGKVVVITGGASGIGAQTVRDFAKQNAKVALLDINVDVGQKLEEEVNNNGGTALFIECDVRRKKDVRCAIEVIVEKLGDINFLINCAAILIDGMIHKISEEEWDDVINTNLKGTFTCIQAVTKYWLDKAKAGGEKMTGEYPDRRIINMSSIAANGNIGQIAYSTSKAGIIGMTNTCAKELIKYNIKTHAILPTLIDTPMIQELLDKDNSRWREFYEKRIPLGIGKPSDVSSVILFLCSQESAFMNGVTIEVNGGRQKFL